jgi:hypothetical protein
VGDVPGREMLKLLHLKFNALKVIEFLSSTNCNDVSPGVAKTFTSLLLVVLVVAKTKPTELVGTLAASHVHAALIFLDVCFAFRARFGVYFEPVARIGFLVAANSVNPCLQHFTVDWSVRLLQTAEAEIFSTVTETVESFAVLCFNYTIALLSWTPLCLLRKIHK